MKVLGIYGSPRKGGNTDFLLDEALAAAREAGATTETVYCRRLKVSGCLECGGCDQTGECVVKDQMQEVYPKLKEADAIILAAPIFFYAVPAQAKAVIDRSQACWSARLLRKPDKAARKSFDSGKGYLIAVGATRGQNLFQTVELEAKYFYDALDMSYEGGLFLRGVEKKASVAEDAQALADARELGARVVREAGAA
ncbi:MAG: flavodoxin family protein [Deltaproteobacteria bacterium]|nr:flavodoxin family protein [Deltaproteobacteria bacterium]